jgi:hypothetical protein
MDSSDTSNKQVVVLVVLVGLVVGGLVFCDVWYTAALVC